MTSQRDAALRLIRIPPIRERLALAGSGLGAFSQVIEVSYVAR
jgi:hypothetical protein